MTHGLNSAYISGPVHCFLSQGIAKINIHVLSRHSGKQVQAKVAFLNTFFIMYFSCNIPPFMEVATYW